MDSVQWGEECDIQGPEWGIGQEKNQKAVEDEIRYTRERIAGSSLRVNIFPGYHSNGDGKPLKIPADTSAKKGAGGLDGGMADSCDGRERSKKEQSQNSTLPRSGQGKRPTGGKTPKFVSGQITVAGRNPGRRPELLHVRRLGTLDCRYRPSPRSCSSASRRSHIDWAAPAPQGTMRTKLVLLEQRVLQTAFLVCPWSKTSSNIVSVHWGRWNLLDPWPHEMRKD